ncbi:unnamed protein product [Eruca vesicaria subsp. sativa]|uniref:HMA domain-containing protein n=1 Tax=Eruca vesicaria subsp. sativa TaxID=29727 RepID=A0ABC8LEC0_ERUVS|nr:unnamed protein product [Eruca vesicaria subsp. sativa]
MATEEMKPETKKTEQKQSPQVKDLTPPSLALPYKTCNLKVSIHCEGCKRKVKKILTSIEGVYRVDIDVKQNNVTVMGIVSPEILLKKLHKAGKNADLLPEIPDPVENKPHDPKENKPVDPKKKNKKKKEEKPEITDKVASSGSDKPESEKPAGAGECSSGDSSEACVPVKEDKCKKKDSAPADSPSPSPETAPTEEKKAEESSGSVGKKKKKKGQNMSSVNNPNGGPGRTRSLPSPITTPAAEDHDRLINQPDGHQMPTNNIAPRQDMYPYPPSYYAPQVMYGVSYNVAQPPLSVDAASYYSHAPPHSYAYMHPGYLPPDQNPYPSRPSDSFELFSDENPNGCSVM